MVELLLRIARGIHSFKCTSVHTRCRHVHGPGLPQTTEGPNSAPLALGPWGAETDVHHQYIVADAPWNHNIQVQWSKCNEILTLVKQQENLISKALRRQRLQQDTTDSSASDFAGIWRVNPLLEKDL